MSASLHVHPRARRQSTLARLQIRDTREAFQAGIRHCQAMAEQARLGPVAWQPVPGDRSFRRFPDHKHGWPHWVAHLGAAVAGAAGALTLIKLGL